MESPRLRPDESGLRRGEDGEGEIPPPAPHPPRLALILNTNGICANISWRAA